jgi:hypothetical protein
MYSKGVSIQLFIVFFSILSLSATVFAEREMFKPVLALDKVEKQNLGVEEIAGTGNYRIYYRGQDGKVHFVRFEPATKVDVIVKSTVEQSASAQGISPSEGPPEYIYKYQIQSLKTSRQPIRTFVIRMKTPKGTKISLINPKNWYSWEPRPFKYAPNWISWRGLPRSDREPSTYIQPGKSLKGFTLQSPGLPGILTAYIRGHITIHELREATDVSLRVEENSVQGKVIGPVPVPEVFRPVNFVTHMESLFAQSVGLGWINELQKAQPLVETLKSVKTALDKNRIPQARVQISEFLRTLDGLSKTEQILTSEAVWLLKLNAQYLRSQL